MAGFREFGRVFGESGFLTASRQIGLESFLENKPSRLKAGSRMRIDVIRKGSSAFDEMVEMWKPSRGQLGFYPLGAFEESAEKEQILGAFDDQKNKLVGYLLFRFSGEKVVIVHLRSIASKSGVCQTLVETLVAKSKRSGFLSITLSCRRDYGLDGFWEKLGFHPVGEKIGRGKDRAILTIWLRQLEIANDLFNWARQDAEGDRLRVSIDANVFYRLSDEDPSELLDEASIVVEDWLSGLVDVGYTNELFSEINRSEDSARRTRRRKDLTRFEKFECNENEFLRWESTLSRIWGPLTERRDQSDLRHVAQAAAAADVFVTLDRGILDRAEAIKAICGLKVVRPSALAEDLSFTEKKAGYRPGRLEGSVLLNNLLRTEDIERLGRLFHRSVFAEKKTHFEAKLRSLIGRGDGASVEWVSANGEPQAIIALNKAGSENEWRVELIRASAGDRGLAAVGGLIARVLNLGREKAARLVITDSCLDSRLQGLLELAGFVRMSGGEWLKEYCSGLHSLTDLDLKLERLNLGRLVHPAEMRRIFETGASAVSLQRSELGLLERAFWPLKVIDPRIETFLVPIRANWAMNLFDSKLSDGDLFGGDPGRLLSLENVFYRAADNFPISAPARLLWYVSKGKDRNAPAGVSTVRACSSLVSVERAGADEVFSKFQRLGVYRRKNVLEISKGDPKGLVMALNFRQTELFKHPVDSEFLESVGVKAPFPGPRRISHEEFRRIYENGFGTLSEIQS